MVLDLRPRLVFQTALGPAVAVVDPATLTSGTVEIPGLGTVPYTVTVGFPVSTVTLYPLGEAVEVPVDLTASGGAGAGTVTLPVLGEVSYEIRIGPQPEERAQVERVAFIGQTTLLAGLGLVVLWLLVRRR